MYYVLIMFSYNVLRLLIDSSQIFMTTISRLTDAIICSKSLDLMNISHVITYRNYAMSLEYAGTKKNIFRWI